MTVSVVFERDLEGRKVSATIENEHDLPESDVRMKWARLTLRYVRQIADVATLEFNPLLEDQGARIELATTEGDLYDEDEDWDDEFEEDDWISGGHFASPDSEGIEEGGYMIGFGLETYDARNRIGGMTTPTVVLAGTVYQQLLRARARAA